MEKKVYDYIVSNCELYNRHMDEKDIDNMLKSYLNKYKEYDENILLIHVEDYHNEKSLNNRTPEDIERAKNWRKARRPSVCSEVVYPNDYASISYPKTRETFKFLSDVLVADIPFGLLTPKQKDKLIDIIQCKDIEEGVVLIQEGDSGRTMYLVDEGCFDVYIKNVYMKSLKRGDMFGEIALMHNINRTATVISRVKSKIWVIEQRMFTGLRAYDRSVNKSIVLKGIVAAKLYPDLTERELISFVNTLSFDYLKEGSNVIVNSDEIYYFTQDGVILNNGVEQAVKQKDIIRNSFTCVSVIEGTVMKTRQRKLPY